MIVRLPNLSEWLIVSAIIGVGISYGDIYLFHLIFAICILVGFKYLKENKFELSLESINRRYIYFFPIFYYFYNQYLWLVT